MKGRFQPSTVGNMIRCSDGGYVCHEDYQELLSAVKEARYALSELIKRNPNMAGLLCGSTTLGNLKAELGGLIRSVE